MEETLNPVSSNHRIEHLNILANGTQVLKSEENKGFAALIVTVFIVVISGIIVYYEMRLKEQQTRNKLPSKPVRIQILQDHI